MLYILRQTKKPKGLYLQIYQSIYDPSVKYNRNTVYKTLGYTQDLITDEIDDPVEYYKDLVKKMNQEQKFKESQQQEDDEPLTIIKAGPFIVKKLLDKSNIQNILQQYQENKDDVTFDIYDFMTKFIYNHLANFSSYKALDIFTQDYNYSQQDLIDGLSFIGSRYNFFTNLFYHFYTTSHNLQKENLYVTVHTFSLNTPFTSDKRDFQSINGHSFITMIVLFTKDIVPIYMRFIPQDFDLEEQYKIIKEELNIDNDIFYVYTESDTEATTVPNTSLSPKQIKELNTFSTLYWDNCIELSHKADFNHTFKDNQYCILGQFTLFFIAFLLLNTFKLDFLKDKCERGDLLDFVEDFKLVKMDNVGYYLNLCNSKLRTMISEAVKINLNTNRISIKDFSKLHL